MRSFLQRNTVSLLVASVIIAALLGFYGGTLYGMHVEAKARSIIVTGELQPPLSVSVRSGDTLWDIAVEHYPDDHTGQVVHVIRSMNPDLDPGNLRPGEDRVALPRLEEVR